MSFISNQYLKIRLGIYIECKYDLQIIVSAFDVRGGGA